MIAIIAGVVLLAGCATTKVDRTGFLGEYYQKLEPGPEGGAKMTWKKAEVDHTAYKSFMVDYVVFALAEDSQYTNPSINV